MASDAVGGTGSEPMIHAESVTVQHLSDYLLVASEARAGGDIVHCRHRDYQPRIVVDIPDIFSDNIIERST
ncbi:hypothetical protein [Mycobacterium sp. pR1184]|uniref:hypothetical protein n=1 Tax=Mycobacterium sp. pR1184 TaxID=3238981 RepID=UPI00351B59F4